jgi:hypothetical protein
MVGFRKNRGFILQAQLHLMDRKQLAPFIQQLSFKSIVLVLSAWGTDMLMTSFTEGLSNVAARYSLYKRKLFTSDAAYMKGMVKMLTHKLVLAFTFELDKLIHFDPASLNFISGFDKKLFRASHESN